MSQLITPAVLQITGVLILLLEIVIPSFGILTLISISLFAVSWNLILGGLQPAAVSLFAIADLITLPICIYIGIKFFKYSPLTNRAELNRGSSLKSDEVASELLGKIGVVETQLKPLGKALIDGQLIEVTSESDVIEKDTPVKVIQVNGMKIIVSQITT